MDPSQKKKIACEEIDSVGCSIFKLSPRSPEVNPTENIFHFFGKQLKRDAITQNLKHKTYTKFSSRAKKTVLNLYWISSKRQLNQCQNE